MDYFGSRTTRTEVGILGTEVGVMETEDLGRYQGPHSPQGLTPSTAHLYLCLLQAPDNQESGRHLEAMVLVTYEQSFRLSGAIVVPEKFAQRQMGEQRSFTGTRHLGIPLTLR